MWDRNMLSVHNSLPGWQILQDLQSFDLRSLWNQVFQLQKIDLQVQHTICIMSGAPEESLICSERRALVSPVTGNPVQQPKVQIESQ